jgi:HPt (histidine-containing phosphotransfer) domain-containing protein
MKLSETVTSTQQALNAFAADLDTVNARITQARSVASAAGLTVTPATIEAPGSAPTHPIGPVVGQDATAFYQAQAAYNTKVSAFNEAQTTVNDARKVETQAHSNLTGPMQDASNTTQNLVTISSIATGAGLGILSGTQGAANDLYNEAEDISSHAQRMEQLALDSELTDAGRAAAARAGMLANAGAAETSAQAAKIENAVGKVPEPIRNFIAKNPGALAEDSSGLLKLGNGVLKNLPYVGTGATILFGGLEVLDGSKTPLQATAETGLSLAGGAAGAMAGAELGAAAGSVVPFLGTAAGGIIGGIAGGLIGSLAGGKAGDQITGAH